jgi:hypothetical protein
MLRRSFPRRSVILGAAALGALPANESAAPTVDVNGSVAHDPCLAALDKLIAETRAAIDAEMKAKPGHPAAQRCAEAKQKGLEAMGDAISASPVRGFADVVLRARLAEYWDDKLRDGFGNDTHTTAELVNAVLTMAGVEPLPKTDNVIRTIPALIAALGSRSPIPNGANTHLTR